LTSAIGGVQLRQTEAGLVSLTDLYKSAKAQGVDGGRRDPSDWAREAGEQSIDFVASTLNTRKTGIYKSTRGKGGGKA